jgi:CHASE3 domain sensor protein
LRREIAQIAVLAEQTQGMVIQQEQDFLRPHHQTLLSQDQILQDKRVLLADSRARLALYDENASALQDKLTDLATLSLYSPVACLNLISPVGRSAPGIGSSA